MAITRPKSWVSAVGGGPSHSGPMETATDLEPVPVLTPAPSASTAASVERVSAASRKPVISISPSPIAAISAARCEIDLSEGGRSQPRKGPEGSKRVIGASLFGAAVADHGHRVAELAD